MNNCTEDSREAELLKNLPRTTLKEINGPSMSTVAWSFSFLRGTSPSLFRR
jgi:hypothetical protein